MSADLSGRRILITGATSGIGAAAATAVIEAGGSVALVARSTDRVAELAEQLGDAAIGCPGDVSDRSEVQQCVDAGVTGMGGLDGVICSAGVVRPGGITDSEPADWRAMFDVNVIGLLQTVDASLPHLRRNDSADIVNLSSMSGRRRASVALGFYAASKFAVHVISDNLREELAPEGIRVSIVSPGFVRTPIFDGVEDDSTRQQLQAALAEKGLDPEAVAAQIVHALAQPPGVDLLEIAMLSTDQY